MQKFLLALVILLINTGVFAQAPTNPKNSGRFIAGNYQHYLEVAAGYGILSKPVQPLMGSSFGPLDVSLTFGRPNRNLNFTAGYSIASFSQDIFLLKPRMAYLGAKYSFRESFLPEWIQPFYTVGIGGYKAIFTEDKYEGIVSYQHKEEVDHGFLAIMRVGVDMVINQFSLTPQFTYFSAQNAAFLAGGFEKQPVSPGYYYLGIRLGYRVPFSGFSFFQRKSPGYLSTKK